MKKIITIVFLIIGTIVIAHKYNFYTYSIVSSLSMEPTLAIGKKIWGVKFTNKEKNDLVTYISTRDANVNIHNENASIGRIVATANDTIEIKNGSLYINNKLADDTLNLSYMFIANKNDLKNYYYELEKENKVFPINTDSVLINVTYTEIYTQNIKAFRVLSLSKTIDSNIFKENSNEKWAIDKLGPFVVPQNNYFILGDNRGNSIDSRERGLVKKQDIITEILTR